MDVPGRHLQTVMPKTKGSFRTWLAAKCRNEMLLHSPAGQGLAGFEPSPVKLTSNVQSNCCHGFWRPTHTVSVPSHRLDIEPGGHV